MVWDGRSKAGPAAMRISRGPLLVLPTITVMIVMFAIFVAGAPRPYAAARIYGGPTEGVQRLAWRVEAVERLGDKEVSLGARTVRVVAAAGRRSLGEWKGKLDGFGSAELAISLPEAATGPLDVSVVEVESDRVLGHAQVSLTQARWQATQRQRGGWLPGRSLGALRVRAAPGRGVFSVPFADPLWIEVTRDGRPLSGASVSVSVDGGEVRGEKSAPAATTNERGLVMVWVAPHEHFSTAQIRAAGPEESSGELRVSLPVVPGALHAQVSEGRLLIRSPIPRPVAYFAWVDRGERYGGGAIALSADGRGGSKGHAPLPPVGKVPLWAVVSSEPDLRSPAAVGWPITYNTGEPPRTLDVYDRLLLDGSRMGFEREQQRLSRVRWVTSAFCAVALALSVALLIARVRLADRQITAHLGRAGLGAQAEQLAPARTWFIVVALLSVLLGFLVLTLLVLYRLR